MQVSQPRRRTDPKFQALLDYCRKNKRRIGVLVVHSFSRFSRNTHDRHAIRAVLMTLGVTLRSVTEGTDDSPEGMLIETMLAG
jgi:DNA invertase Pin-like site-specific DNA recombinase